MAEQAPPSSAPPSNSGTNRSFANMLNEHMGRKPKINKKKSVGFSPWMHIKK